MKLKKRRIVAAVGAAAVAASLTVGAATASAVADEPPTPFVVQAPICILVDSGPAEIIFPDSNGFCFHEPGLPPDLIFTDG